MSSEADEALRYLTEQGFEVRVERRNLHAEYMSRGEPGKASFYAEGREYFCVDLVRDGAVAWPRVAIGDTEASALVNARRWYDR